MPAHYCRKKKKFQTERCNGKECEHKIDMDEIAEILKQRRDPKIWGMIMMEISNNKTLGKKNGDSVHTKEPEQEVGNQPLSR